MSDGDSSRAHRGPDEAAEASVTAVTVRLGQDLHRPRRAQAPTRSPIYSSAGGGGSGFTTTAGPPWRARLAAASARADQVAGAVVVLASLVLLVSFWRWWLEPPVGVARSGLLLSVATLLYAIGVPVLYLRASSKLRGATPIGTSPTALARAGGTHSSLIEAIRRSSGSSARDQPPLPTIDLRGRQPEVDLRQVDGEVDRGESGPRTAHPPWYVPVLPAGDRLLAAGLVTIWVVSLVGFWVWWLQPSHQVTPLGMVLNTVVLLYASTLPAMYVCAVVRLRRFNPAVPVPDLRVAMVVTKAPAEPWAVVEETLRAMLDQDYPHRYDV